MRQQIVFLDGRIPPQECFKRDNLQMWVSPLYAHPSWLLLYLSMRDFVLVPPENLAPVLQT